MSDHDLSAYLEFLRAIDLTGDEAADFEARYRNGDVAWSRIAVYRDDREHDGNEDNAHYEGAAPGAVVGELRCFPISPDEYVLTELRKRAGARITYTELTAMLDRLLSAVDDAATVYSRIDKPALFPDYERALADHGFRAEGDRVEFRNPIAELRLEERGALEWREYAVHLRDEFIRVFARACEDSPDGYDDPTRAFADNFSECDVAAHPSRLQLAYHDGAPVGLFFAHKEGAWGSVSFMGLVPQARGKSFGADVHARAVSQLKREGATTYHDGTSASNRAMIRLFEKMGCTVLSEMREFERRPRTE
jgi:GNAT superfamily N-acetyltransferase